MSEAWRGSADELFEAALERTPEERAAWLRRVAAGEPEMLREVEELLAAHDLAAGVLDAEVANVIRRIEPNETRRIGVYRVVRELGRGGMGVVYLAERDDGQFRRRVAVKLLRGSPDAEELRSRFLAERQILASLDHQNIAQLLDGGVTDGRLPYLVMEYVEGLPITTYCDRHGLDVPQRLRLFQDVCSAVHHAHRNLVIHRDLKPSNILVTDAGQVKLLDFGIAKLLNPGLSALDMPATRTAFRVMTPEYASPEQVRGDPLSTASDVYSLGVVLYELLTGRRPYRLSTRSQEEIARAVCEQDPERPSTAITRTEATLTPGSIATSRHVSPDRLRRLLQGDLDAIVMMALRKEPGRRYGSADLLAEDLHRYMQGLPVLAHHGSRRYYAGKFLRRHRVAALGILVVGISLLLGAGTASWQAAVARSERDRAAQALRQSEEVRHFLVDLFRSADPMTASGAETARQLLERSIQRVEELSGLPVVQAELLATIGVVFRNIGEFDRAELLLQRALDMRRGMLAANDPEIAENTVELATLHRERQHYDQAEQLYLDALASQRQIVRPNNVRVARTLHEFAVLKHRRAQYADADSLYRQALAIRRTALGEAHPDAMATQLSLAALLRDRGDRATAETMLRELLALQEKELGPAHPEVARTLNHVSSIHAYKGEFAESESVLRRALEIRRATLGEEHPEYVRNLGSVASAVAFQDRFEEAEALHRQVIAIERRIYGDDNTNVASSLNSLGLTVRERGRLDEAEALFRESIAIYRKVHGNDHPSLAAPLGNLASVRMRLGDLKEAEALYREALDIRRRGLGPDHAFVATSLNHLAGILKRQGRAAQAESTYVELLNRFRARLGDEHHEVKRALRRLDSLRIETN